MELKQNVIKSSGDATSKLLLQDCDIQSIKGFSNIFDKWRRGPVPAAKRLHYILYQFLKADPSNFDALIIFIFIFLIRFQNMYDLDPLTVPSWFEHPVYSPGFNTLYIVLVWTPCIYGFDPDKFIKFKALWPSVYELI